MNEDLVKNILAMAEKQYLEEIDRYNDLMLGAWNNKQELIELAQSLCPHIIPHSNNPEIGHFTICPTCNKKFRVKEGTAGLAGN